MNNYSRDQLAAIVRRAGGGAAPNWRAAVVGGDVYLRVLAR